MSALERYRALVDDFDVFEEACSRPIGTAFWCNPLRFSPEEARKWFALDPETTPTEWRDSAFRTWTADSYPFVLAYLAGLVHIQEETSMIPVVLLEPEPGESVLDLCAAPGNKTAQLAVSMGCTGSAVANDISRSRLGVVQTTIDRLGLTNVVLTRGDAATFPDRSASYDRVLADVPCTCEGTSRKHPGVLKRSNERFRERLVPIQKKILRRAIELCRPGGRIVYSTCTYAPEECEGVVADVLTSSSAGEQVSLVAARLDGWRTRPGLTSWMGRRYPEDLAKTVRIWPHDNDTGGFFAAVFVKTGTTAAPVEGGPNGEWPAGTAQEPADVLGEDLAWYGIPDRVVERLSCVDASKGYAALVSRQLRYPENADVVAAGVRAVNRKARRPVLSTAGAMLLGSHATERVADLTPGQTFSFLSRDPISWTDADELDTGPVLVSCRGKTIGRALLRREPDESILESRYPRISAGVDVAARLRSAVRPV